MKISLVILLSSKGIESLLTWPLLLRQNLKGGENNIVEQAGDSEPSLDRSSVDRTVLEHEVARPIIERICDSTLGLFLFGFLFIGMFSGVVLCFVWNLTLFLAFLVVLVSVVAHQCYVGYKNEAQRNNF
jgi:hypothetical protein